jgi:hypothetical protein
MSLEREPLAGPHNALATPIRQFAEDMLNLVKLAREPLIVGSLFGFRLRHVVTYQAFSG